MPQSLPGLLASGSIGVDAHGIPHIRAENEHDLFYLQGYNAARERLFQIDLWRKRGLGLLAADFGPGFLEQDRASRLFVYRCDMGAEFAAYGPQTQAICEAFVAGINAFIDQVEHDPTLLPPEFGVLGTRPARWEAADPLRIRTHSLSRNAISEVLRAQVLAGADHKTDLLRRFLEPEIVPTIPDGTDVSSIPLEVLSLFKLAGANVTFTKARMDARLEDAAGWRGVTDLQDVIFESQLAGSNNWAISGAITDTGAPILASDPHRLHGLPSLRMVVHLSCPTLDIIGAGEPCVPGIAIGHNGQIGWALTIFYIDQEDVVFVETDPADLTRYRGPDGWERFRIIEEKVAVKGYPDQVLRLAFTRHGAVVHRDDKANRAYAIRTVWTEPGTAPYMGTLRLMRAKTLPEFRAGTERWGTPSVNFVYADLAGTVAWMPAGINPIRHGHDGLLPVPGDGRYEWQGFRDPSAMPLVVNPPRGFVFSANEMNVPEGWDHHAHPLGFEWVDRSRATRIEEVLSGAKPHGVATSKALQTDVTSIPARRIGALLGQMSSDDPDAAAALALLKPWNHALTVASPAAALFEVWWTRHLRKAMFATLVPETVRSLMPPGDVEGLLAVLERPDGRFGSDPIEGRNRLLTQTLAAAYREVGTLLGSDPTTWAWGRLHHGAFDHALSNLVDPETAKRWSIGPVPTGGSSVTPMHTGYRPSDFRVMMGSSFRLVVDFADFDRSQVINNPGQSGRADSPHYRDLMSRWAGGDYVPLPYTRAAVDRALTHVEHFGPGL